MLGVNSRNKAAIAIACLWAFLVAGVLFWPGAFPLQESFMLAFRFDSWFGGTLEPSQVNATLRSISVPCLTLAALALLACLFRERLFTPARLSRIFSWSVTLGCCWTLFLCLKRHGFEGPWLPLRQILHEPQTLPVSGRRLLMVWLAQGVQTLFPVVSDSYAYQFSVGVAIFLATYATGRWSAKLFGEQWCCAGQILLVAILSPTFFYFTFYDVAMVFFFTVALLFLYQQKYWLYVLAVGVGTLNHENILLLVPVGAFILWKQESRRRALGFPLAALALHVAARAALIIAVPTEHSVDWHLYSNLLELNNHNLALLMSGATVLPWWICGLCGFYVANSFLRRATLLLPLLIGVTYLFGQFHEARQFVAFVPVLIGLILSCVQKGTEAAYLAGQASERLVSKSEIC